MNNTTEANKRLQPNGGPDGDTRDHTRALEEPSRDGTSPDTSVWRARIPERNIQTGVRFSGLPPSASVLQAADLLRDRSQPSESDETLPEWERGLEALLESIEIDDQDVDDAHEDESDVESLFDLESYEPQGRRGGRPDPPTKRTHTKRTGPAPGIRIGSLNIRGRNFSAATNGKKDKFDRVVAWMRENDITILSLLDTHWDDEYQREIELRDRGIQIKSTHQSTRQGGIAFLIDTRIWKPKGDVAFEVIIPGRSAIATIQYEKQTIRIASIYVPNEREEKIKAIKAVRRKLRTMQTPGELILTGDFNMVESMVDRNPMHEDHRNVVREMTKLKVELSMIDGWRRAHPEDIAHTWKGHTNDDVSLARIDRIYAGKEIIDRSNEWEIILTENTLTDHHGVTFKILEPDAPSVGKGEKRINLKVIDHPHFKKKVTEALWDLETELKGYQRKNARARGDPRKLSKARESSNPQISWNRYKRRIQTASREAEAIRRSTIKKERLELDRKLRSLMRKPQSLLDEEERRTLRKEIDLTERKISDLMARHRTKAADTTAAKWFKEDERGSKMWFSQNKERPRRQLFYSLLKPGVNPEEETRNSEEMIEIARKHHETLQSHQLMNRERRKAIRDLHAKVTQRISEKHVTMLDEPITYDEIRNTIRKSKTGKCPGYDGIPNEFWKQELKWKEKASKKEDEDRPDIVKLLRSVLRDIEKHGPHDESFAEARMSLLYKKKDVRKIENYRPITLLNTDYKIYTTVLTKRLNQVAPSIINRDQAGFMPKRSIYDQTKLIEMMIKLCENKGQNGLILALDQEKAYDRIDHKYLWKTMRQYGFSATFTQRISRLYSHAQTAVRLNGFISDPFRIDRGVRQGDPLSCLLYNIAIEPLFESIRTSDLKGLRISENAENALVSAYADDTTVCLHHTDRIETLNGCLDEFCIASTARFNIEKTEVIPVGKPAFRQEIVRSRQLGGENLEESAKIAADGEAVRILGALLGNGVSATEKWNAIIEKQLTILVAWARSYPSLRARTKVARALGLSRALYLMTVNGIPKEQLSEMEKLIRSFIWNGKRGTIAWDKAILPRSQGGLGAPSAKVLYEATKITWLKRWFLSGDERPKWAWAANEIVVGVKAGNATLDRASVSEWAEQKWKSKINTDKLPKSLRDAILTAKKYNLKISVLRAPMGLKMRMPAFSHPGRIRNNRENTKRSKCLRDHHGIQNTGELAIFAENTNPNEDEDECANGTQRCREYAKSLLSDLGPLWNPYTDSPVKIDRYHTPQRLKRFQKANLSAMIDFNPDPGDTDEPTSNMRIFGTRTGYLKNPKTAATPRMPLRFRRNIVEEDEDDEKDTRDKLVLYTKGVTKKSGWENAESGLAVWHKAGSNRNRERSLSGHNQTLQRAEFGAILLALQENRTGHLIIRSSSKTTVTAIVRKTSEWEDKMWNHTPDEDMLRAILHELRTRPHPCEFQWMDPKLEDSEIRMTKSIAEDAVFSDERLQINQIDQTNSRAIHDGARLGSLEMKDIYAMLIRRLTASKLGHLHPERIEIAKYAIEDASGLRPTQERLAEGTWKLPVYPRLRDLIWSMLFGRLKIGKYWEKIPGFEERAECSACLGTGARQIESEHHLWIMCEHNGQQECWKTIKKIWETTSQTRWPVITIGLLQGIGSLKVTQGQEAQIDAVESERLQTMISLGIWAIWKARNSRAIEGNNHHTRKPEHLFIESLKDIINKGWNSLKFETEKRRPKREQRLRSLWENDKIVVLQPGQYPDFSPLNKWTIMQHELYIQNQLC